MIYYGHDLHFLRLGREYELTGDIDIKREADYWKAIELSMMRKAAISYYPSYVEINAIHAIDRSIKAKAITAYVYDHFLGISGRLCKEEGLLFCGWFRPSAKCRCCALVCKGDIPPYQRTAAGY